MRRVGDPVGYRPAPCAWSHRRVSPALIVPPPIPSNAANGPHGFFWIHTWIIGAFVPFTGGGVHVPWGLVRPAPFASTVKHRLSGMCHWVSGPPMSGISDQLVF